MHTEREVTNERLLKLEFRVEEIESDVSEIQNQMLDVKSHLDRISLTLNQVKFILIGAVGFALANHFGLLSMLKSILF